MTRVADDVLGKVARQQWDIFSRVKTGGLSTDRFFRYTKQLLSNLLVMVMHRTWAVAVEAGGYDYDGVYINPEFTEADLPPFSLEEIGRETEINLRQKDGITATKQWLDTLDDNPTSKEKFAHPLKVLAIGYDESTKDEQRENPIFTIWISPRTGLFWYLLLDGNSGNRGFGVGRVSPSGHWGANYRAAAVAK